MSTSRLNEQATPSLVTTWVSLADYREYTVFAAAGAASPLDDVTIQLRKATSSAGANATDHGAAVTNNAQASATLLAEDIGEFSAGVPFTHVSATVTDEASPNVVQSLALRSMARSSIKPNTP